ncbi:MAG TPA: hypothetical protein DET40_12570 [Lentisphaeria bacterium]|nr:MAG: hypothetical protein A2X45_22370 [Lentisphaerae bacterium GWF2_50_93]HCE44373.1 hypothetical protein [Lentisphaeria bacterium]
MAKLFDMGIIDDTDRTEISAGKFGVVAVASFSAAGDNISLSTSEQLNLLLNIANNNLVALPGVDGKYSAVLTKQFEVSVGTTAGDRKINVITSSFIPGMTAIVEDE